MHVGEKHRKLSNSLGRIKCDKEGTFWMFYDFNQWEWYGMSTSIWIWSCCWSKNILVHLLLNSKNVVHGNNEKSHNISLIYRHSVYAMIPSSKAGSTYKHLFNGPVSAKVYQWGESWKYQKHHYSSLIFNFWV